MPPADREAEAALIGSVLMEPTVLDEVSSILGPDGADAFYGMDHRTLWRVIVPQVEHEGTTDLVMLRNELTRQNLLNEVGGVDYLVQLAESVASHLNAEHYARIVADKARLRLLIGACQRAMAQAFEAQRASNEVLESVEREIFLVSEQREMEKPVTIEHLLDLEFEGIVRRRGEGVIDGLCTGFRDLDTLLSGLHSGEMIVVAARPSLGKTALGANIAENVSLGDITKNVLFFSLEMSRLVMTERFLCSVGSVDGHKLRRGWILDGDIARLTEASNRLEATRLMICDSPSLSILDLRAQCRITRRNRGLDLVVVDYLQLLRLGARAENRQNEVAEMSRSLKGLARDLDIPVIVLAQLNRQPEGRADFRPRLGDLRESGAIEQDADVVLLLHREEFYHQGDWKWQRNNPAKVGTGEVIVAKQRNGPVGTVQLGYSAPFCRFENMSAGSAAAHVVEAPVEQPAQQMLLGESEAPF